MDYLPFSQAAHNNREPILQQLKILLAGIESVLEIGAGAGQHAEFFAAELPEVSWQPTEHPDMLAHLRPRCAAAKLPNLHAPIALDISQPPGSQQWPVPWPEALYTANTLHIVAVEVVESLFVACMERARSGSLLLVYGPFNYDGRFTSVSNATFDEWLKERDPRSGIRDFEWVDHLAEQAGYGLQADIAMPANNRLLAWRKH